MGIIRHYSSRMADLKDYLDENHPCTIDRWYNILDNIFFFINKNIIETIDRFVSKLLDRDEDYWWWLHELWEDMVFVWNNRIERFIFSHLGRPPCPWAEQIEEYGEPYYSRF